MNQWKIVIDHFPYYDRKWILVIINDTINLIPPMYDWVEEKHI